MADRLMNTPVESLGAAAKLARRSIELARQTTAQPKPGGPPTLSVIEGGAKKKADVVQHPLLVVLVNRET